MLDLPFEIADEEKIVRAIMCPSHIKTGKNTLKPAAFRSKAGTDDVSVIRQTYMGSDFCKAKAKEIATASTSNSYAGLAFLNASEIRATGSTVQDSRAEYCGHAHISHGIVLSPGEPPESKMNMFLTERCREIIKRSVFYPDPDPDARAWTGPLI